MGKVKTEQLVLTIESRDRDLILETLRDAWGLGKILVDGKDIREEEEEEEE